MKTTSSDRATERQAKASIYHMYLYDKALAQGKTPRNHWSVDPTYNKFKTLKGDEDLTYPSR